MSDPPQLLSPQPGTVTVGAAGRVARFRLKYRSCLLLTHDPDYRLTAPPSAPGTRGPCEPEAFVFFGAQILAQIRGLDVA